MDGLTGEGVGRIVIIEGDKMAVLLKESSPEFKIREAWNEFVSSAEFSYLRECCADVGKQVEATKKIFLLGVELGRCIELQSPTEVPESPPAIQETESGWTLSHYQGSNAKPVVAEASTDGDELDLPPETLSDADDGN